MPPASQERGIRPNLATLGASLRDASIGECTLNDSNMSVSYSAYQPSGQLGSKLEHVIITFQKNEIPLFGRAVEVVGWQSIFIVILCTLKQADLFYLLRFPQH